jgi:hypothetical protein
MNNKNSWENIVIKNKSNDNYHPIRYKNTQK